MDFFAHQDRARRSTFWLLIYFGMAVIGVVASVYAAFAFVFLGFLANGNDGIPVGSSGLWDPGLFGLVSIGTTGLIGLGSLYRVASLAGGGHLVAEQMGGRLLQLPTDDLEERKVLNIVEEMAIASGMPVPQVYLIDDPSINAFAAGFTPADAVVGVTRGCIRHLTRDELQGVIAHEFSHIANGDMRLNLRLMGLLFGILLISLIGYQLMRTARFHSYARNDDRRGGNPLPLLGFLLYVLGYVGVFFGNVIKAAVSRQREYLADASAVQFTRNPDGLAGALAKIGALSEGSQVRGAAAEEASHMFFGNVHGFSLFGMLATHPPLQERIRRLVPSFDGDLSFAARKLEAQEARHELASGFAEAPRSAPDRRVKMAPARVVERVGNPRPPEIAYAAGLLDSYTEMLEDEVRDPLGAQVVLFSLLLHNDSQRFEPQIRELYGRFGEAILDELRRIMPLVQEVPDDRRLPLAELALPALRRLSPQQFEVFRQAVDALITSDREISLFEYSLARMLLEHLGPIFRRRADVPVRHNKPETLLHPARVLLSALALAGEDSPRAPGVLASYSEGVRVLGWPGMAPDPLDPVASGREALRQAIEMVRRAAPRLKERILLGCAAAADLDQIVNVAEFELLRAISESIDCPMPPLPDDRQTEASA